MFKKNKKIMSLRRQGKTKEISFTYSLIVIITLFTLSTSIIYYSAIKGEAINNDYANLINDRNNQSSDISNIILTSPRLNDLLSSNFILAGQAKIFSNKFYYRISNSFNEVLTQGSSYVKSGEYVPFLIEVNLNNDKITKLGKIDFFILNTNNGTEMEIFSLPVNFASHLSLGY